MKNYNPMLSFLKYNVHENPSHDSLGDNGF